MMMWPGLLMMWLVAILSLQPASAFRRKFLRPRSAGADPQVPRVLSAVEKSDARRSSSNTTLHWLEFSANLEGSAATPKPDGEDYRKCAALMNEAWLKYKESPCGAVAHDALFRMRMGGKRCSKLRWGPDYLASYRELLHEWDTWCSKEVECPKDCGNKGKCRRDDIFPHDPRCHCHPHWQGESCDKPRCHPRCQNGTCVRHPDGIESHCECNKGYTGDTCSAVICEQPCKNNGTCTAPNTCSCPDGWKGKDCGEAICKNPCSSGGSCVAPDKCACKPGWKGADCGTSFCETPCENGAKCIGPNKCSACPKRRKYNFTHPDIGDGWLIAEGFSGPTCGDGPVWVFGDLCEKCVENDGSWCLQDGKCSLDEDTPVSKACPKSTEGDAFTDSTPLVVSKKTKDLCDVHYRKCAKIAAPLIRLVNDPNYMDKGFCGESASTAISAMKQEEEHCKNTTIVSLEATIGHLHVDLAYERILQTAQKARKAECDAAEKKGEKKEKEKKKTKDGDRASWYDQMFR